MATDQARSGDSTGSIVAAVVGIIAVVLLMNTCGGTDETTSRTAGAAPVTSASVPIDTPRPNPSSLRSAALDSRVSLTSVEVVSVPADEGFWIGTGDGERVWVELTGGPPESPYDVDKGDRVSFSGHVVANAKGFAERSGVTDDEGQRQLTAQGRHIQVDKDALQLFH